MGFKILPFVLMAAATLASCGGGGGEPGDGDVDGDLPSGDATVETPGGWLVYRVVRDPAALPMGPNLLVNQSFEEGDEATAAGWTPYQAGYTIDGGSSHDGSRSARLSSAAETEEHGLYQSVDLGQTEPRPIFISGWSRSESVTGEENADYSIYLDIVYQDDTPFYGQTVRFPAGTQDWTYGYAIIVPEKPIRRVSAYVLLRRTHTGTAWFDELALQEIQTEVYTFDGTNVFLEPSSPYPFEGSPAVEAVTGDGLSLSFSQQGGAIGAIETAAGRLEHAGSVYASGFFVRDVAADSDYYHPGTTAREISPGNLELTAAEEGLGLDLVASVAAGAGGIEIDCTVSDRSGENRALTVYFALPVDATGWVWGDDIRTTRTIPAGSELLSTVDTGFGSTGTMSRYPLASVSGIDGLAVGYPLDRPAAARLTANSSTGQLYAAFDVALSPLAKDPGRARLSIVIFRHDPAWSFRSAVQKYYEIYPAFFEKRVDKEGIWVAFSDLAGIAGIQDFSIAFHELGGTSQIPFDDGADVRSLRYITEPWSYWMDMDTGIPNDDYDQVIAALEAGLSSANEGVRRCSEAALSSGIFDGSGRFVFDPAAEPWCPYGAVFTLNPDPDVLDPEHPLNKAALAWNDEARAIYSDPAAGVLDGEYADSLEAKASVLDYRDIHLAASDLPLVFDASFRPAVPEMYATYEFVRWLGAEIHGMGKLMMANGALFSYAFPAHVFDIMGAERNWLYSGEFTPDRDATFNFWRTMAYRKPYCLLMNTDFNDFTHEMVERYFKTTLFYGVYPSMFSHNASEDRYWDDPVLVERDRDLFVRYVPLIVALGEAGWEPVTFAVSSDANVYVERYGTGEILYLTTRNASDQPVTFDLTVEAAPLGLPAAGPVTFTDLISGSSLAATGDGTNLTLTDTLQPADVRMLHAP